MKLALTDSKKASTHTNSILFFAEVCVVSGRWFAATATVIETFSLYVPVNVRSVSEIYWGKLSISCISKAEISNICLLWWKVQLKFEVPQSYSLLRESTILVSRWFFFCRKTETLQKPDILINYRAWCCKKVPAALLLKQMVMGCREASAFAAKLWLGQFISFPLTQKPKNWQNLQNLTKLREFDKTYRIWQNLQNLTQLTEFDKMEIFEISSSLQV